ncbi:MAG: polysaccharide deacetylase family protein [Clostridiales bacterium]|nr:polysaccharide deacetylase family protein [Clostridiales bacterium]
MSRTKVKFLRFLGNIVICTTVAAVLALSVNVGTAKVSAAGRQPLYSGKSATKVSLMVNVYWGTEYIKPMLDIFEKYNFKTTFFVGGSWVVGNPDTLKTIAEAGHEIGNHGYYHKDHKKLDASYNRKEISSTHDAVKDVLGIDMTLFAPPSGSFGDTALGVAEELGYRSVMWTRDTIDWRDHDSNLIYKRAVKNIKGGDLILMHPTDSTVKALEDILQAVVAAGLKVAPVSEVLESDIV